MRRPATGRHTTRTRTACLLTPALALAFATAALAAPARGDSAPARSSGNHQAAQRQAHDARVDAAAAARLSGQAARHAATDRAEVLAKARDAIVRAQTVAQVAAPGLAPEQVAALADAADSLNELVEATPVIQIAQAVDTTTVVAVPSTVAEDAPQLAKAATFAVEPELAGSLMPTPPVASVAKPAVQQAIEPLLGPESDMSVAEDGTVTVTVPMSTDNQDTPASLAELAAAVADRSAEVSQAAATVTELAETLDAAARANLEEAERQRLAAERQHKIDVARNSPNGAIPESVLCEVPFSPGNLLRCDALDALVALNEKYKADHGGESLNVISGYRTYATQVYLRRQLGPIAAVPGHSNHGHGIAVDLEAFGGLGDFSSPKFAWMKANGPAFGFHHPPALAPGGGGPQEPWHWEYGG